jgi:dipeptidyl aminopeptidase/acylaminoacyl peptidase
MLHLFMFYKFLVILAVTGIIAFSATKINNNPAKNEPGLIQNITEENLSIRTPSPTPFPFQDMTIPFLRNRKYESKLGDLRQYSDNGSFVSYLTNYDSDGLNINALITRPKGNAPEGGFPAIVFVHGYIAPTIYRTTEKYQDYVNYLARNGFVVFKIDLRGHGSSEGSPGGSYYSGDYIVDTLNAYAALQNSDFVNPRKIGLWGHSMAGNVTLRSFAAKQDIPAVVIWAGAGFSYTDLITYRISDNSYRPPTQNTASANRRKFLNDTYGTFNAEHEFWKQVPATNYLGGLSGAVQLHHAADDATVNVGYSRNLDKILANTSIPHEYYEYKSGGHNLSGSSFSEAMRRTVEFYQKHLK